MKLLNLLSVVFFMNIAVATEAENPWTHLQSDIQVTQTQYKPSKDQTAVPLWIVKQPNHTYTCAEPVVVFLAGFLPTTSRDAYDLLLQSVAKRNILVLYAEYISPSFGAQKKLASSGFDTQKTANDVLRSVLNLS